MNFNVLENGTIYEVLLSSCNVDGTFNVRVFGLCVDDGNFVFELYPNVTLSNIRRNASFVVHFSSDILLYVMATLGLLSVDLTRCADCSVFCEVVSYSLCDVDDDYGKNITTKIIAKPTKIIENNKTLPIINRSTSKIIELLVDYTRIEYMNLHDFNAFLGRIEKTERFIEKNGNEKHKKAIRLIKKEMKKINLHD
ncbi:MAG: hypothetical protein BZ138_04480 [Methanosphaera sp. rholeuAM270]|nr:MAG: hypothetical protein BZ138_04480 [Methanosphaera sp. rholeuAM270]